MKNRLIFLMIVTTALFASCSKEKESEKFRLLTSHLWTSDSLLAEGVDASGPGQMLEKFKGDAVFNKDGTGTFGQYTGTWRFAYEETRIVIDSESLQAALTVDIKELTTVSLKVTTSYPNPLDLANPYDIRMTFKPKQ